MNEVIRFALLGLGVGALYAFASQGLIVIYRGTGVLNFALGATAIAGVFMQWELQQEHGWPFLASAIVGVAWSGFLGALTHWVIMRPLRRASSLVRVIATLGVLITIQAAVVIRYGSNARQVDSWLPTDRVTLWGDVGITVDRLILRRHRRARRRSVCGCSTDRASSASPPRRCRRASARQQRSGCLPTGSRC